MVRVTSFLLLLGLVSVPVLAQDAAAGEPPKVAAAKPVVPAGRITGTVLCGDTHRPARGAVLLVEPVPSANPTDSVGLNAGSVSGTGMARVAMDGTYTLEHLAPGEYSVLAALPGYLSPLDEMISAGMLDRSPAAMHDLLIRLGTVTVTGAEAERYDITLQRGAAMSGRVVYSDGSPATQISLAVEDARAKQTTDENQQDAAAAASLARVMFTHQSLDTDDRGQFRLSGLKAGTYRVVAIPSLANNIDTQDGEMAGLSLLIGGGSDPSALRVYSGDTLHSKAAKTYELRAGDEVTGIDITIPLNAYHEVKGMLTAVDGRTINKGTLTLVDTTDDSVNYQSEVSEDGDFSFPNVAAGTYTLSAKEAQILVRVDDTNANGPLRNSPVKPTNAFADGSMAVIVKDSDVPDVVLTLTEVPLPPQPAEPADSVQDN